MIDRHRQKQKPNYTLRYGKNWASASWKSSIHSRTGHLCCLCHRQRSVEIHHAWYTRSNRTIVTDSERPGIDVFPLCQACHGVAHQKVNWITDRRNPVWGNKNTTIFHSRLKTRYAELVLKINRRSKPVKPIDLVKKPSARQVQKPIDPVFENLIGILCFLAVAVMSIILVLL